MHLRSLILTAVGLIAMVNLSADPFSSSFAHSRESENRKQKTRIQEEDTSPLRNETQSDSSQRPLSKAERDRVLADEEARTGWRVVTSDDAFIYLYNIKSIIRVSEDVVRVWVKELLYGEKKKNPIEVRKNLGLTSEHYESYAYSIVLYEFNCRRREIRILSMVDYDRSEHVIQSIDDKDESWHYSVPNSNGERLLEGGCKHKF